MRIALATSLILVVLGAPAAGGGSDLCRSGVDDYGRVVVICHDVGGGNGGAGGGSNANTSDPYVPVVFLDTVDGIQCVQVGSVRLSRAYGGGLTEEQARAALTATVVEFGVMGFPPCPGAEPISPEFFARTYLRTVQLPAPAPQIDPGRMLVGLEAFLETGSPITYELTEATTPFGPATFSFTSTITVDWADGTTTGPVASTGGPYPGGDLRHVYTRQGDYDIVVTQDWTATWAVGGESGTVTGLQTIGTLPGFPVEEREAVVVGE